MWVRLYRPKEDKEIVINTDNIWKIEVTYAEPNPQGGYANCSLKRGIESPNAIRCYNVYCGGEKILNMAIDPNDPITKVFADIYDKSLKGNTKKLDAE